MRETKEYLLQILYCLLYRESEIICWGALRRHKTHFVACRFHGSGWGRCCKYLIFIGSIKLQHCKQDHLITTTHWYMKLNLSKMEITTCHWMKITYKYPCFPFHSQYCTVPFRDRKVITLLIFLFISC